MSLAQHKAGDTAGMEQTGVVLLVAVFGCGATGQVLVDTDYGPVEGHTVDLGDGSHINSFLGIPFAKPPNGTRRWKVRLVTHTAP